MAIKLIGSYSKKLGLPAYSSHSFAASVETEISDLGQAEEEVSRLYHLLQQAVDREIRHVGFIPTGSSHVTGNNGNHGNHHGTGQEEPKNPQEAGRPASGKAAWTCSDRQRRLILQLVSENNLNLNRVQEQAYQRFGTGLRQLTRQQASDLITELLGQSNRSGHSARSGNGGKPVNGQEAQNL